MSRRHTPWWVGVDPRLRKAILAGLLAICVIAVVVLA